MLKELSKITNKENIKTNFNLKEYTYIKLGGKADFFITPTSYKEVGEIIKLCNRRALQVTILGKGSNLIIRDGGIRGIVLSLEKIIKVFIMQNYITTQAGASLIDVSKIALQYNLSGLEFACGIPGTVGGAVFMNAGAYGGEIADILESVLVIDKNGELVKRDVKDLELGYRKSSIDKNRDIVVEATFKLKYGVYEDIKKTMDELTSKRENSQPLDLPSCGSVFKRPVGHYVGPLIIECNLQGYRIGGAKVSKKHAGFIVNVDNATAKNYIDLIELIQKTVKEKTDVSLEPEVRIIGED